MNGVARGGHLISSMVRLRKVEADKVVVVKQGHVSDPMFDGVRRRLLEEAVGVPHEHRTVCLAPLKGRNGGPDPREVGCGGRGGRVVGLDGDIQLVPLDDGPSLVLDDCECAVFRTRALLEVGDVCPHAVLRQILALREEGPVGGGVRVEGLADRVDQIHGRGSYDVGFIPVHDGLLLVVDAFVVELAEQCMPWGLRKCLGVLEVGQVALTSLAPAIGLQAPNRELRRWRLLGL